MPSFPFLLYSISFHVRKCSKSDTYRRLGRRRFIADCVTIFTNKNALKFPLILTDGHYLARILKVSILTRVKLSLSIKPSGSNIFT